MEHGLPPFIDASCRREPDLESAFPSITATCRAGCFAPRLKVGDVVMYLSVKGKYGSDCEPGWRLVAVLEIHERFASHELAAAWYRERSVPLPSNCFVEGNEPKPFGLTHRNPPKEVKERAEGDPVRSVRLWDALYRQRVAQWPVFLTCRASFVELHAPPQIREKDFVAVLGKVPGTLNPPEVWPQAFEALSAAAQRNSFG